MTRAIARALLRVAAVRGTWLTASLNDEFSLLRDPYRRQRAALGEVLTMDRGSGARKRLPATWCSTRRDILMASMTNTLMLACERRSPWTTMSRHP